jgi:hypothetical protein
MKDMFLFFQVCHSFLERIYFHFFDFFISNHPICSFASSGLWGEKYFSSTCVINHGIQMRSGFEILSHDFYPVLRYYTLHIPQRNEFLKTFILHLILSVTGRFSHRLQRLISYTPINYSDGNDSFSEVLRRHYSNCALHCTGKVSIRLLLIIDSGAPQLLHGMAVARWCGVRECTHSTGDRERRREFATSVHQSILTSIILCLKNYTV